jgi:hypothetical protein
LSCLVLSCLVIALRSLVLSFTYAYLLQYVRRAVSCVFLLCRPVVSLSFTIACLCWPEPLGKAWNKSRLVLGIVTMWLHETSSCRFLGRYLWPFGLWPNKMRHFHHFSPLSPHSCGTMDIETVTTPTESTEGPRSTVGHLWSFVFVFCLLFLCSLYFVPCLLSFVSGIVFCHCYCIWRCLWLCHSLDLCPHLRLVPCHSLYRGCLRLA